VEGEERKWRKCLHLHVLCTEWPRTGLALPTPQLPNSSNSPSLCSTDRILGPNLGFHVFRDCGRKVFGILGSQRISESIQFFSLFLRTREMGRCFPLRYLAPLTPHSQILFFICPTPFPGTRGGWMEERRLGLQSGLISFQSQGMELNPNNPILSFTFSRPTY